jgi:hypothetical protein
MKKSDIIHSVVVATIISGVEYSFNEVETAFDFLEQMQKETVTPIDCLVDITLHCEENRHIHAHSMEPNECYETDVSFQGLKVIVFEY